MPNPNEPTAGAIDAELTAIAYKHMGFATLERRNMDSLDFRDVACWSAKAALEAAYEAGRAAPRFVGPGLIQVAEELRDDAAAKRFSFALNRTLTLAELIDANRDDEGLCEWLRTAKVGEAYPGVGELLVRLLNDEA